MTRLEVLQGGRSEGEREGERRARRAADRGVAAAPGESGAWGAAPLQERAGGRASRAAGATPAPERAKPPREDALPEHLNYRDDGCDLFSSCLSCPLPRCRYDVPGGARAMLNVIRDVEIRRMHFEGDSEVDEIARRFRISRRTVFRVLRPGRGSTDALGGAA